MTRTLRAWRVERGLSTRRLAELAGASNKTVVQAENGRHTPSFGTIEKLSTALGVEPRDVVEFDRALDQHAGIVIADPVASERRIDRERVFCVSESASFLALVRRLLEGDRFGVTTVAGTPVTFDQVAVFQPDVLIIELEAGRTLGWDLIERLAHEATTHEIPIIATARDKRLLARAQALRKDDDSRAICAVPFDRDLHRLVEAVESVVDKK